MTSEMGPQDRKDLDKFVRFLTLKVAQIVVQSRQGKNLDAKDESQSTPVIVGSRMSPPPSNKEVDWFNLAIPELAEVTIDTKRVLNGEIITALSKVFIIEISLRTDDGDEMILELWTIRMNPECDPSMVSLSTIYYRMGIMLKSTLTISRIAPAYKISRCQHSESYTISYRIYSGQPNTDDLGEGYRFIKVSELGTLCGTIQISLLYRTMMSISPSKKQKTAETIMMKSDHFPTECRKKEATKEKVIDLNKPLTAGAFVDVEEIKKLHRTLSQQLPPDPPMAWLLAEKEKMEMKMQKLSLAGSSGDDLISSSAPGASNSKAIEVPLAKNRCNSESQKYLKMLEFPFAEGSPITELANFYQECIHARNQVDEWSDLEDTETASTDSEAMSRQLKVFEDNVPEFDNMLASMLSNSDNGET